MNVFIQAMKDRTISTSHKYPKTMLPCLALSLDQQSALSLLSTAMRINCSAALLPRLVPGDTYICLASK